MNIEKTKCDYCETEHQHPVSPSESTIRIPYIGISEDQKSRIIAENPTAAVREKLRWLDERNHLDWLNKNLKP